MKKLSSLFLLLAAALMLPLASCGNDHDEPKAEDGPTPNLANIDEIYADYLNDLTVKAAMSPAIDGVYKVKVLSEIENDTQYVGAVVLSSPAGIDGVKEMMPKTNSLIIFPLSTEKLKGNGVYDIRVDGYFSFTPLGLRIPEEVYFYCIVQLK